MTLPFYTFTHVRPSPSRSCLALNKNRLPYTWVGYEPASFTIGAFIVAHLVDFCSPVWLCPSSQNNCRICFEWLISGRLQARSSTKLEREKTFNYIMTAFQVPEKTEIPNFFGATNFLITRHGWKKVRISLMRAPGLAWPGLVCCTCSFVCLPLKFGFHLLSFALNLVPFWSLMSLAVCVNRMATSSEC